MLFLFFSSRSCLPAPIRMPGHTFSVNYVCHGRVNSAPILFVADDRGVGKQRAGWSLESAALHEFAEVLSSRFGELRHVLHQIRMVGCNVRGFGLVGAQVVQNGGLKAGERFVPVPERQLLFASRQVSFHGPRRIA